MKRKHFLIIFIIVCILSFGCFIVACTDGTTSGGKDLNAKYVVTNGNGARIEWDRVEGAAGYKVYKGPSRYATYSSVSSDMQTATYYECEDKYAYFQVLALDKNGNEITREGPISYELETFGENVYVFASTDKATSINNVFNTKYKTLVDEANSHDAEFSDTRFAALFKSGSYATVEANVGYYTTIAGLGLSPNDVMVKGIDVKASTGLVNFWRGVENLTVNRNMTWQVSQATSLRKVKVNGNLNLFHDGATSGGFMADCYVTGTVTSGSQQQWLSRNCKWNNWQGKLWNMFFAGIDGATPSGAAFTSETPYTNFENTDKISEKPYLTFTVSKGYQVFLPEIHEGSKGISWSGTQAGTYLPLSDFYVARSDRDNAQTINTALAQGKNLILTPGIYKIDQPILIENPNTVVFGMGLATLKVTDNNADTLMRVADVDGVRICGVLFDAGKNSNSLLEIGSETSNASHSQNPIRLSDLFFRVGGASDLPTHVDSCVVINSNDVLGDNFWVWRADHKHECVSWTKNTTKNGIIVNGDNVLFYGLFVEHFHEYQTIWNGQNGTTYFYQSEIPYDPPTQDKWMSHNGTVKGYSSYKIGDNVTSHNAYAMGIYSYLRDGAVKLENAIETPKNSGIRLEHIVTIYLAGNENSGINHIVNGVGDGVSKTSGQARLDLYVGG